MSKKVHLFKHNRFKAVCGKFYNKSDENVVAFNEFENDTPHERVCLNCKNTEEYRLLKAEHESKRPLEKEEFEEPKTQLQIDTEKYNLNEEQVDILGGFDYEVVCASELETCSGCIFFHNEWSKSGCAGIQCYMEKSSNTSVIFKQIHKTPKSLNEAIEKESNKEPVEEPFVKTYKIDDFVGFDTVHINTTETTRIFDENGKMIWVRPPEYDPKDVAFNSYITTPDKYKLTISNRDNESIVCDIYDLIKSIGSLNSAHDHAIKKVLVPGKRGAKDVKQDLNEAIESLKIAIKLLD